VVVSGLRLTYPGRISAGLDLAETVRLPPRSLVAVVGPSGSGKSTLLSVLAGEVFCQQGSISTDTLRLDRDSVAAWREQVAWLPQRPWLESGSIRDNLLVARPDADDVQLWDALTHVGLREVVAALPGGLDAPVGEDGSRFSAGQRARLALARAVIARRPLVLVDEPSAHLDPQSEQVVIATLTRLARRSTVVVVTHSPRLLAAADLVITLTAPAAPAALVPTSSLTCRATDVAGRRTSAAMPEPRTEPSSPRAPERTATGRWVAAVALGILASACGVALTVTSGWLIARASQHPPVLFLTLAIVAVRTFGISRPLLRYAERLLGHDSALRLLADRRADVYDTIVPLTPGALGRRRGDVLTTVVDDVDALLDDRLRVRSPLFTVVGVGALCAACAAAVLPAAGLAVAGLVAGVLLLAVVVRWRVSRAERDLVRLRALVSARVLQAVQGARDLVLWQATPRATAAVDDAGARLDAANRSSGTGVAVGRAAVTCAVGAGVAGLALLAAPALSSARLSGPMAVALVLLPLALLEVLGAAPDAAATSVRTHAAKLRLESLEHVVPAVTAPPAPVEVAPTSGDRVSAEGLACGWTPLNPVFTAVQLDVAAGRRLGVVGASGSGKSTLAAALVRFIDPTNGRVLVGDVDLREIELDDVHRLVGLVEDDPYVFSSSVLENVRLARPQAGRDEVEAALRSVSLGPWLDALPEGLDTLVGDGHDAVSGGERARLGLARAMLADTAALVLDEPTAHLDASTAQLVASDILTATEGRAVVWITHDSVALGVMDAVLDLTQHPRVPFTASTQLVGS
jgi:ATP-binding cassette subfamily C protein CydCD